MGRTDGTYASKWANLERESLVLLLEFSMVSEENLQRVLIEPWMASNEDLIVFSLIMLLIFQSHNTTH